MRMQSIWKKTLISLLILVTLWTIQKIDTPITNGMIFGVNRALNFEYNYSALWQQVSPLVAKVCEKENWTALQQMAKIRLKARENEEKSSSTFIDLEGQ